MLHSLSHKRLTARLALSGILIWFAFSEVATAQELEPRRWTHLPVDTNYLGVGYVRTEGDIFLDPVLEVEEGTIELDSLIATYIRTFNWSGKTARVDVHLPLQSARWQGLLAGEPASVEREGMGDPRIRVSVNFLGAPALKGQDFRNYRASNTTTTIAGAALAISLPLGQYYEDKLLNLGSNRFIIRPQIGALHVRNRWSFELTGSAFFYTDNDEFWNGNTREQEPLYLVQGHVIHTFNNRLWLSASAGYDWGGKSTINGASKDDKREDFLYALSAGKPLSKTSSIKLAYVNGRTREEVGSNTDNLILAISSLF